MQISPSDAAVGSTPNTELLRGQGWLIVATYGPYCTAWKDNQEIILFWKDGRWIRLWGKGGWSIDRS